VADRPQRNPTRGRGARTLRLGRVAAGGAVRWASDRVDGRGSDEDRRRRRGDRLVATIDSLVDQLGTMRGAAMKAGQVLSTVEFPGLDEEQSAHLQARLASLRDNVPAVGWKQMRKVIFSEWGEEPERVLGSIDPEPAAAASIGQVYRGQTTDGVEIAVKVQYPGIGEAVESDMRNVRLLAPLLRRLMPGLDVKPVLVELSERISAECDYELEASSHRRLARFWRGHPFITVPAVDTHLSRRRVLVSEWVDGIDFAAVGRQLDPVRDRYAEIIYRFYYGVARELDLALGDPHPGNYLLCDDGRVAFLDFGMVRELPRGYLAREAVILAAIRGNDQSALVEAMRMLGYLRGNAEWNGTLLLDHMRAMSWWLQADEPLRLAPEDVWRGGAVLREQRNAELMQQMRRMNLPPEALLLRRMEGLLFQVATSLRAEANWGALLGELIEGGEPLGRLGREHAAWRAERGLRPTTHGRGR
jgi:predicted unusual protein kinase regulating ubiquinone biosynthesis (AarF/ABC1/UbiB family)